MKLECILKVSRPTDVLWLGRRPGRHQANVRKRWPTQNICVMTCYYRSQPGVRGYRQRLHAFWKEKKVKSRRANVV